LHHDQFNVTIKFIHQVPDFKSLHEDFHNRLLAKKSAFQPTVPQDFAAARPSVKKQQAEEEKKKQEAQQEKEKQEKEKNKTKENTLRLSSSLTESKLFQVGELTQLVHSPLHSDFL
jgi:hypothetical protein